MAVTITQLEGTKSIKGAAQVEFGCCQVSISNVHPGGSIAVFDGAKCLKEYTPASGKNLQRAVSYAGRYNLSQFKSGRR